MVRINFGGLHHVAFNPKKSQIMVIKSNTMKDIRTPVFTLCDSSIPEVKSVVYLGHVLNTDLSDDCNILRQRRLLYARGNLLLQRFSMCTIDVKSELFRAYFSNIYCCQLWWNCFFVIKSYQ